MPPHRVGKTELHTVDLQKADERYHFKLSDILRRRRRPLLLIIDNKGQLLFSSLTEAAESHEQRLLDQALAEARGLFHKEFKDSNIARQLIVEKPGERCALVLMDNECFSLKLFPLRGPIDDDASDKYAALVEPIVKPLSEGIDFEGAQEKWHLSRREVDVLQALMSGDPDKEIARSLTVSVETVRAYLKSIRSKLGVATRTAIVHVVHKLHSDMHRDDGGKHT